MVSFASASITWRLDYYRFGRHRLAYGRLRFIKGHAADGDAFDKLHIPDFVLIRKIYPAKSASDFLRGNFQHHRCDIFVDVLAQNNLSSVGATYPDDAAPTELMIFN